MKWQGRAGSSNIEDRRGMRMALPVGGGIGGLVLLLLFSALTGQNPADFLPAGDGDTGGVSEPSADDPQRQFISVVLKDTEDTWTEVFREHGAGYREPTLVLFTDATPSACGTGQAAMGPFYCPGDQKVYLDLSFFRELDERFGAPGDFAQAYVVAHEIGHHVQTLTGLSDRIASTRQQASRGESNALSVRQELQADCYAGVWGHYAGRRGMLDPGDAEEGLRAAAAIGDDRLQRESQGRVVPESFTHGSSEQRVSWLRRGLESGRIEACDTFAAGGR
ncbi:MAG TPA: neutral zinc metallopeptidase [Vicinamibacterales bacterium]|nr:neutral zinc metallopeptidase [Vicinamibacterales bacterium]